MNDDALTMEKMRIHERLGDVEKSIVEMHSCVQHLVELKTRDREESMSMHLSTTQELRAIRVALDGNGKDGVILRVDRIEQKTLNNQWWQRGTLLGVLGLILKAAWEWVTGHR